MPAVRCRCGRLTTTKYPCKVCGSTTHLAHGHPADGDTHFEDVEHEWHRTGGTHPSPDEDDHWLSNREKCERVHRHPYEDPDHTHESAWSEAMEVHSYGELEVVKLPEGDPLHPGSKYRWHCACGASGRWTYQSILVARHGHGKHQERKAEQARREERLKR